MPRSVCRVLGFSKQAYCQRQKHHVSKREREEQHLVEVLRRLHEDDEEGGYRVFADDIQDLGYSVSERRVWRLCRQAGIRSTIVSRKSRYRRAGEPVGDDLVARDFTADRLDEKWLVNITEHWTNESRLYLCAFKDVGSRRIVGYAIDSRMKASMAVRAPQIALINRGHPRGVIVHSDRGGQFRSRAFQHALRVHELQGAMGRAGACRDNAAKASSACCRGTFLTGDLGPHENNSAWRSSHGSKGSITANDDDVHSVDSHRSSSRP